MTTHTDGITRTWFEGVRKVVLLFMSVHLLNAIAIVVRRETRGRVEEFEKRAFYSSAFLFCCLQLYSVLYAWLPLNGCFWTLGTGLWCESWFSWIRRCERSQDRVIYTLVVYFQKMFLNSQDRWTVWRAVESGAISLLNDAHRQTRRHGGETSYFGGSQYDIHSSDCPESKGKGVF